MPISGLNVLMVTRRRASTPPALAVSVAVNDFRRDLASRCRAFELSATVIVVAEPGAEAAPQPCPTVREPRRPSLRAVFASTVSFAVSVHARRARHVQLHRAAPGRAQHERRLRAVGVTVGVGVGVGIAVGVGCTVGNTVAVAVAVGEGVTVGPPASPSAWRSASASGVGVGVAIGAGRVDGRTR